MQFWMASTKFEENKEKKEEKRKPHWWQIITLSLPPLNQEEDTMTIPIIWHKEIFLLGETLHASLEGSGCDPLLHLNII
jgi:hypothetical protein